MRGLAASFTIENFERRSQNRQNKLEFCSSYCFLTISFLLFKHASHSKLHVAYQWFHIDTKRLYHEKPRTAGISGAAGRQEGSG
jgi:hypothetical protein